MLRKVDGEEILSRVERHGVTLLCGAPAVVAAILGAAETRAAEGRAVPGRGTVRIVVAGAPPPSKTIERVETELGWEFIQIYGLTETSPLLTINRAPAEWDELGRGRAVAAAEPRRARRRWACRSPSTRTARCWRGPITSSPGTGSSRVETEAALAGGWFHTGDGGYLDGAYVVISDRKKDVIITGGENVSSIEVEDCLYQHAAVAEVAVIGVPDEKWGETIKALVVVREGSTVERGGADRALPGAAGPLQGSDERGAARRARPDGDRQAAEVQAPPALLGGAGEARQLGQRSGGSGPSRSAPP